jgi:hypothetical protein
MTRAEQLQALHDAIEAGKRRIIAEDFFAAFLTYSDARALIGTKAVQEESVDAAIAFQQAVAPECGWSMQSVGTAQIYRKDDPYGPRRQGVNDSPAIALVLATLRYLKQKEQNDAAPHES